MGLLPLDRRRWLAADVIHHANAVDLLMMRLDTRPKVIRQVRPVRGHEVDGFHRTQKQPSRTYGHRPSRRIVPAGTR